MRRVSVVAAMTAASAVVVYIVGLLAAGASGWPSFAVLVLELGGLMLIVGLWRGSGTPVAFCFLLCGVALLVSEAEGTTTIGEAALLGVVVLATAELARVSFDARRPARFDRHVIRKVGMRAGLVAMAALVVGSALSAVDHLALPTGLVPAGLAVAALLIGSVALAGRTRGSYDRRLAAAALVATAIVVVAGLAAMASSQLSASTREAPPPLQAEGATGDEQATDAVFAVEPPLSLPSGLAGRLAMLIGILALGLFLGQTLRRPPGEFSTESLLMDIEESNIGFFHADQSELDELALGLHERAAAAVDDALVELRSEDDPARAVRIAYATVQSGFGDGDLARRRTESEIEFLTRMLTRLGASSGDMRRLTVLFEQARFSDHEIDESMRAEAIGALSAVRGDLVR